MGKTAPNLTRVERTVNSGTFSDVVECINKKIASRSLDKSMKLAVMDLPLQEQIESGLEPWGPSGIRVIEVVPMLFTITARACASNLRLDKLVNKSCEAIRAPTLDHRDSLYGQLIPNVLESFLNSSEGLDSLMDFNQGWPQSPTRRKRPSISWR